MKLLLAFRSLYLVAHNTYAIVNRPCGVISSASPSLANFQVTVVPPGKRSRKQPFAYACSRRHQ